MLSYYHIPTDPKPGEDDAQRAPDVQRELYDSLFPDEEDPTPQPEEGVES